MSIARFTTGLLASVALALPATMFADEASQTRKMRGYDTYQENCASCHGPDGMGDGPDAGTTRVPTADLTTIAARRGGEFPEPEIVRVIDGRTAVRAHGQSGMPVWGKAFAAAETGGGPAEVVVKDKIHLLVEYLKAIQRSEPEPVAEEPAAVPPVAAAPPPAPAKIVLRGVTFEFDSDALQDEARPSLDAAIEVLQENPDVRVDIAGFTDSTGPELYNVGLSERRAAAVRGYLEQGGVDASRLRAEGKGPADPVADNDTRDGRAQNRRVELTTMR